MSKIGIINYGLGNLHSVKNSLDYLNIPNKIINKPEEINHFDKIILPGVGAFGAAMKKLDDLKFADEIKIFASKKKPILGICLGMQLLFDEGHEHGQHKGLGLIAGKVLPFSEKIKNLPIPLIGWNSIKKNYESPLVKDIGIDATFYFVHSFYCKPTDKSATIATSDYGLKFSAIVGHANILGCQFHPEKSQSAGLKILSNFNKI